MTSERGSLKNKRLSRPSSTMPRYAWLTMGCWLLTLCQLGVESPHLAGLTMDTLRHMHVAGNTHSNTLAAIGNRHYSCKSAEREVEDTGYTNGVGNPIELIRRATHCFATELAMTLINIDESKMKGLTPTVVDPPECEMISEIHRKTIYPDFKLIEEIMPGSFTEAIAEEAFGRMSGCRNRLFRKAS